MNTLSLKLKLGILGTFFIAVMLLEGFMLVASNDKLGKSLNEVGLVDLPAVRDMTLIDMMHDGLKSTVFTAIHYADSKDTHIKNEITKDLKDMIKTMNEKLAEIENLPLNSEIKQAALESEKVTENYIKSAEEIVALSFSGRTDLAKNKLPSFEKSFTDLEVKFEALGELIEHHTKMSIDASIQQASNEKQFSYIILLISVLIGGLVVAIFSSKLSKSLNSVAEHLNSNADQVASAAQQIASSSQELSAASTEQAASLEQTAASLEQITSMISKATESAEITSETTSISHKKAEQGRQAVDQMLTSMDEISQSNEAILIQINESNRQMSDIVKVIQDIGNRTKVINEIVFQTKLLSFNASVEAARAGEHGKGFAVVAEEVGNLAQMSGNAAKEITDMLDASISKVEGIVRDTQKKVESLVKSGKEKVDSGVTVARQCSDVLNEIVQNASRVSGLSQEISQAAKEQSQGVLEINKAMSQLDTVTQQNAASSEEAASAADELSAQAESLKASLEALTVVISGKRSTMTSTATESKSAPIVTKFSKSKVVHLKDSKPKTKRSSAVTVSKKLQMVSGDDSSTPDRNDDGFQDV